MPVNAVAKLARAPTTRMSPANAIPNPAPTQAPPIPTTTGTESVDSAVTMGL